MSKIPKSDGTGKYTLTPTIVDLDELRDGGYLLEANRRFFHPLGLALFIEYDADTGEPQRLGVYDWREYPEGNLFDHFTPQERERAARVGREWKERAAMRQKRFGFVVQPSDDGQQ